MIRVYVEYTNDTSIIEKALPTLEKEHQFFMNNRTVEVEVDGETYRPQEGVPAGHGRRQDRR